MFIADIGINHNGDIDVAFELIKKAKESGVDIVKFQKRNVDICLKENQKNIMKDSIFGKMKYIDYKRKLEFGKKEYDMIDKYCKELNIRWAASVWDIDSLNFILNYDTPFIKVPSALITNTLLMKEINNTKLPIIFSTGMSTMEEITTAYNIVKNNLYAILHCNSSYPTESNEADLLMINTLRKIFKKYRNRL